MSSDFVLFRVNCPLGYVGGLRGNNWQRHLAKHPELDGYLNELEIMLAAADSIVEFRDGSHHFYKSGVGRGRLQGTLLYAVFREFDTDESGTRTLTSAY